MQAKIAHLEDLTSSDRVSDGEEPHSELPASVTGPLTLTLTVCRDLTSLCKTVAVDKQIDSLVQNAEKLLRAEPTAGEHIVSCEVCEPLQMNEVDLKWSTLCAPV